MTTRSKNSLFIASIGTVPSNAERKDASNAAISGSDASQASSSSGDANKASSSSKDASSKASSSSSDANKTDLSDAKNAAGSDNSKYSWSNARKSSGRYGAESGDGDSSIDDDDDDDDWGESKISRGTEAHFSKELKALALASRRKACKSGIRAYSRADAIEAVAKALADPEAAAVLDLTISAGQELFAGRSATAPVNLPVRSGQIAQADLEARVYIYNIRYLHQKSYFYPAPIFGHPQWINSLQLAQIMGNIFPP